MLVPDADRPPVVSPPAEVRPAGPAWSAGVYAAREASPANRRLQLLAGLLAVARDLCDGFPPADLRAAGRWADGLAADVAGVGWSLNLALGAVAGVALGPPADPLPADAGAALAELAALAGRLN